MSATELRMLFVTWDGPQVSYLEGLFLPIFARLKLMGIHVDVLQFRWGTHEEREEASRACAAAGCGYRAVNIQRWGGGAGPFWTALAGARQVRAAVREFGSSLIMPRSMMPAISVLAAGGDRLRPIIFDADGLAADERVDVGGLASTSVTYRILRDVEAQIIRRAAGVITRTDASAEILYHRAGPPVPRSRFSIVTNGRDEATFHPQDEAHRSAIRAELNIEQNAPLLVYAGSVGPQYRLDAMRSLLTEMLVLKQDARLLFLTGSPEEAAAELQHPAALVMRVPPHEVPRYLAAGDLGLGYRTESFAMQGVAPIKLSEYLLCGVPVAGTGGIGNTRAAVAEGVFMDDPSGTAQAARWAVGQILPARQDYRVRARAVGVEHYSLTKAADEYARAIRAAASRPDPA